MNSDKVYWLLKKIAATSSIKQKEELIRKNADNLELKRVLEYAYNPFKHYNCYSLNEIEDLVSSKTLVGFKSFNDLTWSILNKICFKKVRGSELNDYIKKALTGLTIESADLLIRILRKNLRAGISVGIINKAIPGLVPTIPYMRCSLATLKRIEKLRLANGVYVQEKMNGMFVNISRYVSGGWSITTRQGNELPVKAFELIISELSTLPLGYQLHGELLVMKDGKLLSRSASNGIISSIIHAYENHDQTVYFDEDCYPIFVAWDAVRLEDVANGSSDIMYAVRFGILLDIFKPQLNKERIYTKVVNYRVCYTLDDILKYCGDLIKNGSEGGVAKGWFGTWLDGTSLAQLKIKPVFEMDLKITGILDGTPGTKLESKPATLICESEDGGLISGVAIKDESMRRSISRNRNRWMDRIVSVMANNISTSEVDEQKTYSLENPRLVESVFRVDKVVADTTERVIEQYQTVINGNIVLPIE